MNIRFLCAILLISLISTRSTGMDLDDHDQEIIDLTNLFLAIQAGDLNSVIKTITAKPTLAHTRLLSPGDRFDDSTATTIAAKSKQIDILCWIAQHEPKISATDHVDLWSQLTQTPQNESARPIIALIKLMTSSGFAFYSKSLSGLSDTPQLLGKQIDTYLNPPQTMLHTIPVISHAYRLAIWVWNKYIYAQIPKAHQLLYTAALHGNSYVVQLLLENHAGDIHPSAYCRAASYANRCHGNSYIALYIICHRIARSADHPLYALAGSVATVMCEKSKSILKKE